MFNPHNPNIVIGSTMSGYLLEWDIRAKKNLSLEAELPNERIDPSQFKRAVWRRTGINTRFTVSQSSDTIINTRL